MKTINIKKILVPLDFSKSSIKAMKIAASIAVTHNASVQLLHVTDNDFDLYASGPQLEPLKFSETTTRLGVLAKSINDQFNIECFYTSEFGSITHCILRSAIDIHADLIIMGKNGDNQRAHVYAGTHCCQVAEKSRIPVIIVPEAIEKCRFENILFPVRPLLSTTAKYDAIRSLLTDRPVVTILNLRDPANENELHIIHQLNQLMKTKLEQDRVPYSMEYYFKDNKFAENVLAAICRQMYDLVIISSEAEESKMDFHIGEYAQKIIHGKSVPLLLLHAHDPILTPEEILDQLSAEFT